EHGEQVIRPLTKEELDWLSQFYAETEHGNFKKNAEIEIQESYYKRLNREMRHNKKKLSADEFVELNRKIEEAYKKLVHLREETNTFYPEDSDRHEIFNKGNSRKLDIFNRAKVSNNLISLDLPDYDQFTSKAETSISPEHRILDYLTKKPAKKVVRRRKKS
ncbi:MAG TPA: hypothetical protein VGD26_03230, partial [Chitinophagaceae bacterium]